MRKAKCRCRVQEPPNLRVLCRGNGAGTQSFQVTVNTDSWKMFTVFALSLPLRIAASHQPVTTSARSEP
eukprot:3356064-Rhodomonas_salina.1